MLTFNIEHLKGSKNKRALVLKATASDDENGKREYFSMISSLLGVTDERQQSFLFDFINALEQNLFLGSVTTFAKNKSYSSRTGFKVIKQLQERGLVEQNNGFIRVSDTLLSLFSLLENGQSQIILDLNVSKAE
jgi:hypothetical protein